MAHFLTFIVFCVPLASKNAHVTVTRLQQTPIHKNLPNHIHNLSMVLSATALNYANLAAFLLNLAVTFGVSYLPGAQTNDALSAKYQTLITPSGYAFAIWGIIFTTELIGSVSQVVPSLDVAEGARSRWKWNFVGANVAQAAWGFAFAFEYVELSVLAMFAIWYFLLNIVLSGDSASVQEQTRGSQWLLNFPIDLHAGWITAALFVNVNLVLVKHAAPSSYQLVSAAISLIGMVGLSTYFVWKLHNLTMGIVLVWAVCAVAVELRSPLDTLVQIFSAREIAAVRFSAIFGGCVMVAILIVACFWNTKQQQQGGRSENERLLE